MAAFHSRARDDEWHLGAAVPEGIFAGDAFFAEMPTVIAPEHDDGIVGDARLIERGEQSADLGIDKTGACQVAANKVAPLVVFFDPLESK